MTAIEVHQDKSQMDLGGERPLAPVVRRDEPSMTEVIMLAIEKGTDPAALEKLVDLKMRVLEREARMSFTRALARFQRECPQIPRTSVGVVEGREGTKQFDWRYAKLEKIDEVAAPILRAVGLAYRWDSAVLADGKYIETTCILYHVDGHEVKSSFAVPVETRAGMQPQQKFESALSYGQRRTLLAVLGLVTTEAGASADASDPTPVDGDQTMCLEDTLREIGADEAFRRRFLKWLKADSIAQIRAVDFPRAMNALEQERDKRERAAQQEAK